MGVVQKIDYPQLIHPPRLLLFKKGSWELKSSMVVRRCWVSTAVLAVVVVMPGGCMVPSTGDLANSSESRALIASRPQYSNKICWIEKSQKLFFCLDSPLPHPLHPVSSSLGERALGGVPAGHLAIEKAPFPYAVGRVCTPPHAAMASVLYEQVEGVGVFVLWISRA